MSILKQRYGHIDLDEAARQLEQAARGGRVRYGRIGLGGLEWAPGNAVGTRAEPDSAENVLPPAPPHPGGR